MLQQTSRSICLATALVLALALPLGAQGLQGRVLDAETGAPVVGAIVKATVAGGGVVAGSLTDSEGDFTLLPPPEAALAAIVLERIGYASHTFDPQRFAASGPVELRVEFSPVQLQGIVVTAESLCGPSSRATGPVHELWEEARKSLEIAALSQDQRILRYETQNFNRDLRPTDFSVLRGSATRQVLNSAYPYRSIPIEQMTERGWAEPSPDGGMVFYAPDATVLLTDAFAGQHCFRGEVTADSVLLHFDPNQQRRRVPELRGTLVLHPETLELTELRFAYVSLPDRRLENHAGGEIRFFAAPNGLRVVQDWAIRAPVVTVVQQGLRPLTSEQTRVEYIHEQGGRVLAIHTEGGTVDVPVEPLDLPEPGQEVALTGEPQVAATRQLLRGAGAELLLQNNADSPYQVTQIQLRDCVNTALACGDYPVNVIVEPGEQAVLMRLRPAYALDPVRFRWFYVGAPIEPGATVISGRAAPPESARPSPDANLITAAEIPENRFANALELVRTLRPLWLRTPAIPSLRGSRPVINVYLDNVLLGSSDVLRDINPDMIERIHWLDAADATLRWGTGNSLGAILIITRNGG